jgi:hypothetical protein
MTCGHVYNNIYGMYQICGVDIQKLFNRFKGLGEHQLELVLTSVKGVTTPITGFKIRFSLTHKAIWCLTVYYGMDGQAFHSVHGSSRSDPIAGETEVNVFKLNFNDILE